MSADLIIRGGRVIDPLNNRDETVDLFVSNGVVRENPEPSAQKNVREIDASGKIVSPGFIDLRAHLREPGGGGRENIASGSAAAAAGGFTTLVCMPDVTPSADNPGTIRYVHDAIAKAASVNILPAGCMTIGGRGEFLAPIGSLKQAGVVALTDCPNVVQNNEVFRRILEYSTMFDLPIFECPYDSALNEGAVAHEGIVSLRLGLRGSPRVSEELGVSRAVLMAESTGARVHLQSLSASGSVEILRRAKERGVHITADVTPHHLAFNDAVLSDYNPDFKVSPPIREESDRMALAEGLLDGTIDSISSAHEPYLRHEKDMEFDLAPFGVIGLETALPACLNSFVEEGPGDYAALISALSSKPAAILGLEKGRLSPGDIADITIFDPNQAWTVESESLERLSFNTPWAGKELLGRVTHLVVAGKVVRGETL